MRSIMFIPLKFFLFILLISLCSFNSVWAQSPRSIISRFDLYFAPDLHDEYWSDYTNEYYFLDASGTSRKISTVDTIYKYAEKVIGEKLSLKLKPQQVEHPVWKNGSGRIEGLPNGRPKEAAFTQSYDTIIQVRATVISGGSTTRGDALYNERKQKIDMIVEILVFDKNMKRLAKYRYRTRMDEIKFVTSSFQFKNKIELSGYELYQLFVQALANALVYKK